MLESSILVIHRWAEVPAADGILAWSRSITDRGGQPLGFVRFSGDRPGRWFAWLRRVRLEIFETPDASHLMSVTRAWGLFRNWQVQDADENLVGGLYARSLVSSENHTIGRLDPGENRILDPSGRALATFIDKVGVSTELTFTSDQPINPFERMLILGCILSLAPTPPR